MAVTKIALLFFSNRPVAARGVRGEAHGPSTEEVVVNGEGGTVRIFLVAERVWSVRQTLLLFEGSRAAGTSRRAKIPREEKNPETKTLTCFVGNAPLRSCLE